MGFAEVWEARSEQGVPCAIKVSREPLVRCHPLVQEEYQALQYLKGLSGHPRIVTLMDIWIVRGYLVTRWELAPDRILRDLEQLLFSYRAHGRRGIPFRRLIKFMYQAAEGLDFLHSQRVYHGDVKPRNLLLFYGHVKLGDLGLARLTGACCCRQAMGTWGYFPIGALPELGPHVDLYGLAATYIKLRTGHEPFGTDPAEILKRQKTVTPILTGLSRGEQTVVLQAFTSRPCHRYTDRITSWVEHLHCAASEAARYRSGQARCALAQNTHSSRKYSTRLLAEAAPIPPRRRSQRSVARRANLGFKYLFRNLGLSPTAPLLRSDEPPYSDPLPPGAAPHHNRVGRHPANSRSVNVSGRGFFRYEEFTGICSGVKLASQYARCLNERLKSPTAAAGTANPSVLHSEEPVRFGRSFPAVSYFQRVPGMRGKINPRAAWIPGEAANLGPQAIS